MAIPKPEDVDFVIYHAACSDGFGARFSAEFLLRDKATYFAAKHGTEPPDVTGKNVAIVDFSYNRETILHMNSIAKSLVILDHHKTAQEALEGLDFAIFDMNKSGAMLAWEFFNKNKAIPTFIQYIQDRDLWKFELQDSKQFSAAFDMIPFTFDEYYQCLFNVKVDKIIKDGYVIIEYNKRTIERACKHAMSKTLRLPEYSHYTCCVVNSPTLQSEIGNFLAEDRQFDIAFVWYYDHTTSTSCVSIRTAKNHVDVSALAKFFGGGGHKKAAGFRLTDHIDTIFV